MSDPILGLAMLGLIIVVIMLGFPTAFTLMGLGMMFGFVAFYDPSQSWTTNKVFTLMVQRTFGGMTNDVLLSIPLFVLMGYVMERGALVDKMFYSIQLAFRRVPASLAVATLIVCTFWGIASGLVGAVVVLMGVIAMKPMLNAGYDTRLAAGVITAGGTLGILIPPSVMIIVYAAVAGQSVVKLYAAAMVPGFFLAFLYLVYIIGWALINPKVAPKLPPEQLIVPVPASIRFLGEHYSKNMLVASFKALFSPAKLLNAPAEARLSFKKIVKNVLAALTPLFLVAVTMWGVWWYVIIHQQAEKDAQNVPVATQVAKATTAAAAEPVEETLVAIDATSNKIKSKETEEDAPLVALDAASGDDPIEAGAVVEADTGPPENFGLYFGLTCVLFGLLLVYYYLKFDEEQFEILKLLIESVMPLGVLTRENT